MPAQLDLARVRGLIRQSTVAEARRALSVLDAVPSSPVTVSAPITSARLAAIYATRAQHVAMKRLPVFGTQELVDHLRRLAPSQPLVVAHTQPTHPWVLIFLSPELDIVHGCVVGETKPYGLALKGH